MTYQAELIEEIRDASLQNFLSIQHSYKSVATDCGSERIPQGILIS